MIILPNGATFLFPVAQERTLDGTLLFVGVDSQLEAGFRTIEGEIKR